jgi:hypothetical protein
MGLFSFYDNSAVTAASNWFQLVHCEGFNSGFIVGFSSQTNP